MATVQLKSQIHIELSDLIGGVSQLDTAEIEQLLTEIGNILARRKATSLPERESYLLQAINQGVEKEIQVRYDELQKKLLAEQITPNEHVELLSLVDIVENADAERLQHLIELSQLRQISLDTLMAQLGIHQPPAHG